MRALVAYGTKYGSTAKVAEEIASVLTARDHRTDVVDLRNGGDLELSSYDLVIIGSGIAYGSWSKGALRFLDRRSDELRGRRLAMFACCGDVMFDPGREDEHRSKYLTQVAADHGLSPFSAELFGGVLDFSKYGFLVKGILNAKNSGRKYLEDKGIDPNVPYDFRDWEKVRSWASSLSEGK